jgi:hypothetical protein
VNKQSATFIHADAEDEGSKRALTALMQELKAQGHDVDALWGEICSIIVRTILSIQPHLAHTYHAADSSDGDGGGGGSGSGRSRAGRSGEGEGEGSSGVGRGRAGCGGSRGRRGNEMVDSGVRGGDGDRREVNFRDRDDSPNGDDLRSASTYTSSSTSSSPSLLLQPRRRTTDAAQP